MSTTIQQVPAWTYNLDPVHSTFGFAVTHNGVSRFRGHFDEVDARIENGALVGTAHVASVSTPIPQLNEHLLAPDFFDAANAPTVSFQSADIRIAGDGEVVVDRAGQGVTMLRILGLSGSLRQHSHNTNVLRAAARAAAARSRA